MEVTKEEYNTIKAKLKAFNDEELLESLKMQTYSLTHLLKGANRLLSSNGRIYLNTPLGILARSIIFTPKSKADEEMKGSGDDTVISEEQRDKERGLNPRFSTHYFEIQTSNPIEVFKWKLVKMVATLLIEEMEYSLMKDSIPKLDASSIEIVNEKITNVSSVQLEYA